jgi:hypothetical protein
MDFILQNLRLKELVVIVQENRQFFDDFVSFLESEGYSSIRAFMQEPSDEKALKTISKYLRRSSKVKLYDGLLRPYSNSKAKTRETMGGGHALLFTRDIFKSIPTNLRPSRCATTAVVPLPINGSRTMPPSGQPAEIHNSTSFSGKTAKCALLNFESGISHTVRRFRPLG